ncbi:hypothetical protein SAMN05443549_10755 [Flavobacterium fluvii]|uniref:DUF4468 domain-containing protein n=1 Tax=Flavobacterium fluvii TaxID=468056 RepID=A0A1M5MZA0_9FLAO|nr:hypothetical protein [Flavobacterium fluvii]SHG82640.1 hypothetical protein SAMN05443549_10755 [Flavobacterium fluvii]
MKKTLILIFLFVVSIASAQRYNVLSGDLKNLKGIALYNVTFDYSGQNVQGFETEEAFLKEKMDKRKEKDGAAEKFKKDWYEDRENKYEPKFIEYFNKRFEKGEIKVGKNIDAKYTMNIKTTWIYPGYNVVAGAEPAKISAIITVVETENPKNILVSLEFYKSIGLEQGQFDFDQGYRIAGAYERLAKNLLIQLKRFV